MIKLRTVVCLNWKELEAGDHLRDLTHIPFVVTHVDDEGLYCIHSFPENTPDAHIVMGLQENTLIDLSRRMLGTR